jgi:hypothetical protein
MTSSEHDDVVRAARRFGWVWLVTWAAVGAVLEALHGFKVGGYLDDELARLLLRLGHAHGVGTALVVLVWSSAGAPLFGTTGAARLTGRALRLGAALLPTGFALSAFGHPEGDPSPLIVLVPLGAASLLFALFRTALAAFHASRKDSKDG